MVTCNQLEAVKVIFESCGVTAEMLKKELNNGNSLDQFGLEEQTKEIIKVLANTWE